MLHAKAPSYNGAVAVRSLTCSDCLINPGNKELRIRLKISFDNLYKEKNQFSVLKTNLLKFQVRFYR